MKLSAKRTKKLRIAGLAMTLGCTVFAVGKLAIAPPAEKAREIVFPDGAISLSGWSYRESRYLEEPEGKFYRYEEGDRILEIEMRYITYTDGNLKKYLQTHKKIDTLLSIKQQPDIGFYGLFANEEKAYLTSCLNPRGPSTVTAAQFSHNRNTYDLQWHRILWWMLGRSDLRQWNCLWVNLSIPLDGFSQEETYSILEQSWLEWYNWWVLRDAKMVDE